MKIHFKFEESDPKDTRFTVVIDDKPCGQLSMMTGRCRQNDEHLQIRVLTASM